MLDLKRATIAGIDRGARTASPLASLLLAIQATSPLGSMPHAPGWFNWLCVVALFLGLAGISWLGEHVERLLGVACLLVITWVLLQAEPWAARSAGQLASRLSEVLSTTRAGFAWTAVASGWAVLGLAYLNARSVLHLSPESDGLARHVVAWLLATTIGVFGVRGVMGYASGSASLLDF